MAENSDEHPAPKGGAQTAEDLTGGIPFAHMLDTMADGFWLVDQHGRLLDVNRAYVGMSGYAREELLAMTIAELDADQDATRVGAQIHKILDTGTDRFEARHRAKSGEIYEVEVTSSLWRERGVLITFIRDLRPQRESERALAESERRYRLLFETLESAFALHEVIYDDAGKACDYRYVEVNPAYGRVVGREACDLVGRTAREVLPSLDPKWVARFAKVVETGEVHHFEEYSEDVGRWVGGIAYRPAPGQFVVLFSDVSARKASEAIIARQTSQLLLAQEIGRMGYWNHNVETGETTWSDLMYEILGWDRTAPVPTLEEHRKFIHADHCEAFFSAVEAAGRGVPYDLELRIVKPDQSIGYVLARGRPQMEADGRVRVLFGTALDITERKASEQRLAETLKNLELAQGIAKFGNFIYDPCVGTTAWSQELHRIFGKRPPAAENAVAHLAEFFRGEHAERFRDAWTRSVDNGHPFDVILRVDRTDKASKWIRAMGVPDATRGPAGYVVRGVIQDITEQHVAEEEQERLQQQLLHADKMESVGRLAGGVAHDFNNMLGVILGNVELALQDISPDQPLYQDLREIEQAARRSAGLTRQLLTFARRQTIQPRLLDVNETIGGMMKMLRRLIGEDTDLRWAPSNEACTIRIDPVQLDQVLVNLCVNARDALGAHGRITIETRCLTETGGSSPRTCDGESCSGMLLRVSDDGCGMDEETLENIFEPFFTTKGVGKGTGLGLATVYGIVDQNGGTIEVESRVGEGTRFDLYFPAAVDVAPDSEGPEANTPGATRGETVLLVEDEAPLLELVRRMLVSLGYRVITARGPMEAFEQARKYKGSLDLLVSDVVMPDMNGVALSEKLRAAYPALEVVFISGHTADHLADTGIGREGFVLINKPFTRRELAQGIQRALANAQATTD